MNKLVPLLLSCSLVLGSLAGCAAETKPYVPTGDGLSDASGNIQATSPDEQTGPQELTLVFYPDRSLNPFECTDFTNRTLFSLIYQSLFSVDRNYDAVPILCKEYKASADYRTYTIYLADATFSDGTPLTADDVIASYQAAKASKYYGGRFLHVSSVALSEDGGIKFTLDTPMEELYLLLDFPIVKADEVAAERPLGTGPYIMEDALTGTHLRRLPGWSASSDLVITAESIPLVNAESPSQIRDEFEFGDVGLVCANPCADTYADFRCDYELWDCEAGIFLYLGCNVAYSQDGLFSKPEVRAALTYAIDRRALAEKYYHGFAQPTTIPVSPSSPYYSAALASRYSYNPSKFIDVIQKTTLPKEPIRLLVNKDDSLRLQVARDIAHMLTESGMPTEVMALGTAQYNRAYYDGNFDLYLGQTRLSPNMDLTPFFHPYGNIRYNGMADAMLYNLNCNALENHGNYYNLHKAVADDGRLCPILFGSYAVYASRGLLTDLSPSRDNVFFYTVGRTMDEALIPPEYTSDGSEA